jgi:alkylation response protein AidB-like acyl-CoA dehydrogenase
VNASASTAARRFDPLSHRGDAKAFRTEVAAWLSASVPADWMNRVRTGGEHAYVALQREWFEALRAVGLHTAHWPKDWGGEELSLSEQVILYEELARASAPYTDMFTISLYHLPATLFAHGTPEQRERYLAGVRDRGEVWCQGFSEPGAGSDLASLRTRAERQRRDGREVFVVNGQKVWSSHGVLADYCLLLARTDPNAPRKQSGISYFILDMKTPGVTVRPIRQITAEAEFAEIFLEDVVIPVENLIGAENDGWRIAQSTLTAERGILIFEYGERLHHAIAREATHARDTWLLDPVLAQEFSTFYPRARALSLLMRQMLAEIAADPHRGGGESATYIKLYWAMLLQDYNSFLVRAEGLNAQLLTPPIRCGGLTTGDHMYDFLKSYSWTIAGGSNEVMRNVISERLLGLPR